MSKISREQILFKDIWYASEDCVEFIFRYKQYESIGFIKKDVFTNEVFYIAKEHRINLKNITAIYLGLQKHFWIRNFQIFFSIIIFLYTVYNFSELYFICIPALFHIGVFSLLYINKWIVIEYIDERNTKHKAYFADGAYMGWRGLFGSNKRIYTHLMTSKNIRCVMK